MRCPHCLSPLDVHVNAHDHVDPAARPRDGDVSLCFYCLGLIIFTDGRERSRRATPDEAAAIKAHEEYAPTVAAILASKQVGGNADTAVEHLRARRP